MKARTAVGALILMVSLGGPSAQTPQQTRPTFRAAADVVPLSVTVVDKSGRPVTDLKATDFTILEDRKPREIVNFFTQTFTPEPASVITGALNRAVPKSTVEPEKRRTFLFVLGDGRIQYPAKALDGVLAFVRQRLLPQDLVAVMGFDRATDFTNDHAQIARMLERYRSEHERILVEEMNYRQLGVRTLPRETREDVDAIFTGVPTPRVKSPSAAWSLTGKPDGSIRSINALLHPSSSQEMPGAGMIRGNIRRAYAGIEYLRYVEGEKHMVYLGDTGLVPWARGHRETDKEDDAKFARRLNDARITLDMIRTAGVPQALFGPPSKDFFEDGVAILGFQYVADLNGGTYTGVNYADKALEKVDALSRFSYLIGYAPSNPTFDGQYRNVEVIVNRKDVVARYRHGYYAAEAPEPPELRELIYASRLEQALAFDETSTDIKIDARAELMPRLGTTQQLSVDLTLDASRLTFGPAPTGRAAEIELRIYVGDDTQRIVGEWSDRLRIRADEAQQAEFIRTGISHAARIPLTGTPRYVKVIVYDYGADLVGTSMIILK